MSVKDPGNTFNLAKSGQEFCRPWTAKFLLTFGKVKGIARVFN
jgi:hypothetical protein